MCVPWFDITPDFAAGRNVLLCRDLECRVLPPFLLPFLPPSLFPSTDYFSSYLLVACLLPLDRRHARLSYISSRRSAPSKSGERMQVDTQLLAVVLF